jgi:hypothetical protein
MHKKSSLFLIGGGFARHGQVDATLVRLGLSDLEVGVADEAEEHGEHGGHLLTGHAVIEDHRADYDCRYELDVADHVVGERRGGANHPVDGKVDNERVDAREEHEEPLEALAVRIEQGVLAKDGLEERYDQHEHHGRQRGLVDQQLQRVHFKLLLFLADPL